MTNLPVGLTWYLMSSLNEQGQHLGCVDGGDDAGHEHLDDVAADDGQHLLVGLQLGSLGVVGGLDEVVVLGGDNDGVNAHGRAVVVVFDGHLALRVGAQVSHLLALTAYVGQHLQDAVCQVKRKGHVVLGLIGGIAEHHALVAGTLFHGVLALHAAVDVGALLVNGAQHAARVALEHVLALGITDFLDDLAGNELEVHIGFGFHFTCQYYLSGSHQRFASYF